MYMKAPEINISQETNGFKEGLVHSSSHKPELSK